LAALETVAVSHHRQLAAHRVVRRRNDHVGGTDRSTWEANERQITSPAVTNPVAHPLAAAGQSSGPRGTPFGLDESTEEKEPHMRSFHRLVAVAGTIVALTAALTVSVPSVLASSATHTLAIVKDCSGTMTGKVGEYCTVTSSNVPAIPKGTKVVYSGPVISSSVFLSSTVIIKASPKNTATGYCMVDLHTGIGMCTFWKGTGTLAGFHAVIHGSSESPTAYHWDGFYYRSGK
jgi:hypothetical protein